jgi:hypothetical protein
MSNRTDTTNITHNNTNINNLNVFTFIREIYQSLKHLDMMMNTMSENFNSRLTKLEENQLVLKTRFDNVEILLQKTLENSQSSQSLNKNIEHELLNKMSRLNNNTQLLNKKIDLKPNELTFANVLENNYDFEDINNQLLKSEQLGNNIDINGIENTYLDIEQKQTGRTDMDSLLF